ncbi:MAG: dihydrolipoamide acetyltransferase family protein [Pseudomonadota bacterium]
MKIFNLPDLGEGLADAEIRQWYVKVGDTIKVDQPLVSVETAKAVVEVPSPQTGKIAKLYGGAGDVINTGAPLVEFAEGERETGGGSIVGSLEESSASLNEDNVIIGSAKQRGQALKAMPAVRALAKQLNVDLAQVTATGAQQQITLEDVKKFAGAGATLNGGEKLQGVRRAMAKAMTQSHQEIAGATIVDDVDITDLAKDSDVTVLLLKAMAEAIKAEPSLNAWFDGKNMERKLFEEVNIGLAMDMSEGLFVPVLKNIGALKADAIRAKINEFKESVKARTVAATDLQGATISLSNFGMFAGRYATPLIVPPMVAILGCGKIQDRVVVHDGKMAIRRLVPLSLTFDHRAVTGGEASRYLAAVMKAISGVTS